MINREKRDNSSFLRERTLNSLKENPYLENNDVVYVASEHSLYDILAVSSDSNKVTLANGLFAVLRNDPKRYTKTEIDTKLNTKSDKGHKHGNAEITDIDASKITSGTINIERLPAGSLERCVVVADDTARFALTKGQVQIGDTVKVTATNKMYFIIDDTKLNVEAGYTVYTAGTATEVPWSGVTGKPSTFPPSAHNQAATTITEDATHRFTTDAEKANWNGKLNANANAVSATKLATARTIALSGGIIGTATAFDGTVNISIPTTLDVSKATAGILAVARGGTGNATNASASCTGNSATATKLQTARTINGVGFDGTANITITAAANGGTSAACSGNSATATKLATARTIGSAAFDGTANITLAQIGAAASNHTHGYMPTTGGTFTGNVVGQASYTISGFGKVYNAVWNDYAELFERGEDTEPGDIIALDTFSDKERYIKADCKHHYIVGVHSNSFAHLIGGEEPPEGEDYFEHNIKKFIPVGLAGRVMCKVIGPVKKGDYIGVSKIPGVGIANESITINRIGVIEASVVGMALENKETEDIGLVKILID